MLLFYSIPRKDTNDIAHELIKKFGSFSGVFDASYDQLKTVKGITDNSAVLIKMIAPVYKQYRIDKSNSEKLFNVSQCGEYLMSQYAALNNERIMLICLNASNRVLGCEKLGDGDVANVSVNFRKVVETILKYPTTVAVILAHNHPDGVALPSREDIEATIELRQSLRAIDINLIDHIIVSENDYISMAVSSAFKHIFEK
jgi:DNA repair protein RadC